MWNGLSGVSRPVENVSRFGVESTSAPARRQHAAALAQEPRLVPQVLDDLQRHDVSTAASRTGSATRLVRAAATRG